MADTIQILHDELSAQRTEIAAILEGMMDLTRLNLTPAAMMVAQEGVKLYTTRLSLLTSAIAALTRLMDQTFPALPRLAATAGAHADLRNQRESIEAALGQIDSEAEVTRATLAVAARPET